MATLPSRGRVQARQRATVFAANQSPGSTLCAADTVACNGQASNRSHADEAAAGKNSAKVWARVLATADATATRAEKSQQAPAESKKAYGQKQHAKKQRRWVKKEIETCAEAPKTDVEETDVPGSATGTGDEQEQDTPKQRDQPGNDALDCDPQAALSSCSTDTDPVIDGEPMYSKPLEQEPQDDRLLHNEQQEPEQQKAEQQQQQPPQQKVDAEEQLIPEKDRDEQDQPKQDLAPKEAMPKKAWDRKPPATMNLLEAVVSKAISKGEKPPAGKRSTTTHDFATPINLEKLVGDQLPDSREKFRLLARGKNKQPHQGIKDAAFAGVHAEWAAARGPVGHGRGTTRSSSAVPLATLPPRQTPLAPATATPFLLSKAQTAKPMCNVFINNLATAPKAPTSPMTLFQDPPVVPRETPVLLGRTAHDRSSETPKDQVQVVTPIFVDDSASTQAEVGDGPTGGSSSSSTDGDALAPNAKAGNLKDLAAGVETSQPSSAPQSQREIEETAIDTSNDTVSGGPADHSVRVLVGFLHLEPQCLQESVRHIVNEGWANITWKKRYTALHLAAEFGRHDVLPLLIALQADPSAVDNKGRTALEVASSKQNWDCVRLLTKMTSYRSPSKTLVAQEMVKLLDIKHARLSKAVQHIIVDGWDKITWRNQYTAMHLAAFLGREDVAMMLVSLGGDLTLVDSKGRTAADVARERQHWGCAWTLSQCGRKSEGPAVADVAPEKDASEVNKEDGNETRRKALRLRKDEAVEGDVPTPREIETALTKAALARRQQAAVAATTTAAAQPCWVGGFPSAGTAPSAMPMQRSQADIHPYMLNPAGLQDWMALHKHKEFCDIAGF